MLSVCPASPQKTGRLSSNGNIIPMCAMPSSILPSSRDVKLCVIVLSRRWNNTCFERQVDRSPVIVPRQNVKRKETGWCWCSESEFRVWTGAALSSAEFECTERSASASSLVRPLLSYAHTVCILHHQAQHKHEHDNGRRHGNRRLPINVWQVPNMANKHRRIHLSQNPTRRSQRQGGGERCWYVSPPYRPRETVTVC